MTSELEAFKKELITFLKTSSVAMSKNAAALTPGIRTWDDKQQVLELVNHAITYMDLVTLIREGTFDVASD